jgi:hypothetical protein
MKNKNLMITILFVILVGGASFFGGMKYQQGKVKSFTNQFSGGNRVINGQRTMGSGNRNGNGMTPVAGEVTSKDDKSITVKMNDGSSKIIIYSNSTVINKTDTGSIEDVKVGENISVFGTSNTDGSVTAQNIQIGVLMRNANPLPTL